MKTIIAPYESTLAIRITEYDFNVLQRTATDMLNPSMLRNSVQGVLDYCKMCWIIPMNKYYLTGRQVRALGFIMKLSLQHISELSQSGKSAECADFSIAVRSLPMFVNRTMDWEEVIEPLYAHETRYKETGIRLAHVLVRIRDKPTIC